MTTPKHTINDIWIESAKLSRNITENHPITLALSALRFISDELKSTLTSIEDGHDPTELLRDLQRQTDTILSTINSGPCGPSPEDHPLPNDFTP